MADSTSDAHFSSCCHRSVIDPIAASTAADPSRTAQIAMYPSGAVSLKTGTPAMNAIADAYTYPRYTATRATLSTTTGPHAQIANLVWGAMLPRYRYGMRSAPAPLLVGNRIRRSHIP